MAKVTVIIEMESGERIESTYEPFDRVVDQFILASEENFSNHSQPVLEAMPKAFHAGMQQTIDSAFKAVWEGFGPNGETIYERNVTCDHNDPHYAFYDTKEGQHVWIKPKDLPQHLNKLRA